MAGEVARIDRIEGQLDKLGNKIDELTKVVATMARIEERMVSLFRRLDKQDERMDTVEKQLIEFGKVNSSRGAIFRLLERGFWLVAGAIVAYYLGTVRGN